MYFQNITSIFATNYAISIPYQIYLNHHNIDSFWCFEDI